MPFDKNVGLGVALQVSSNLADCLLVLWPADEVIIGVKVETIKNPSQFPGRLRETIDAGDFAAEFSRLNFRLGDRSIRVDIAQS